MIIEVRAGGGACDASASATWQDQTDGNHNNDVVDVVVQALCHVVMDIRTETRRATEDNAVYVILVHVLVVVDVKSISAA